MVHVISRGVTGWLHTVHDHQLQWLNYFTVFALKNASSEQNHLCVTRCSQDVFSYQCGYDFISLF